MNLIVVLVVWGAGMVILYRWYLVVALRRAFREEVFAEPVAAGMGEDVRPGGMLNYASHPRKMSLGRRWPIIHAVIGAAVLVVMAIPLPIVSIGMVFWGSVRFSAVTAWPCGVAFGLALGASVIVAVMGLRDEGGRPAAVTWRYVGRAALCWVGVLALTWLALEWRMQRMMDETLARANTLAKEIEIVSEDGAMAADLYTQAGVLVRGTSPFDDSWKLVDENGGMVPPSAFPEKEEFRIPLLRKAAGMKTSGLLPAGSSYSINTLLPHLAGMRHASQALKLHATSEARAGRIGSAVEDINAIDGMGDHAMQGLTMVEMLVGIGLYALADETLQEVLPMVKDQGDLDRLRMDGPAERMKASRRAGILGELGVMDRNTVVTVLRGETDPTGGRSPSWWFPLPPCMYRVLLGDRDITVIEEHVAMASAFVADDPAVMAGKLPAMDAWFMRERGRSPLSAILVPSLGRAMGRGIEAGAMVDISRGAVAATRFRLQKGRLPASWDELVTAKLMPAAPIDPFDGKPIRFAVHQDFIFIYTIGVDRIDNGGAPFMVGRGGAVTQSNPGMIISVRPLWELDLVPKGFVPATQPAE